MFRDPLFLVSVNLLAAFVIRIFRPNLFSAVVLLMVMIASSGYLASHHGQEIILGIYQARDVALTWGGKPATWPPEKFRTYPDLELIDQDGNTRRLSEFKGKVILLEPVGMSCPACISFSGGQLHGPFAGTPPQSDLESIDEYAKAFGKVDLDDPRLVFVQLILFDPAMKVPTQQQVSAWAKHFDLDRSPNRVVLGGTAELATPESRNIIPGFQLIDKNFVLRMDSTGEKPSDDLYTELLPAISQLLQESPRVGLQR